MSFFKRTLCLSHQQCGVCFENKIIRDKNKSKCNNLECTVYICDDCLQSWYYEKQECPICHTSVEIIETIEDIEDIETQNISIKDRCNVQCNCNCDCKCYCIELLTRHREDFKIPECVKLFLYLSIIGFIIFNCMAFLSIGSFSELFQETKDFYTTWYFYLLFPYIGFICTGLATCTYVKCEEEFNSTRRLESL